MCICPQMTMDYDLEQNLHDIDEFIESELGFPPLGAGGTLSPAEINDLSFFLQSSDFSGGYHAGNNLGKIRLSKFDIIIISKWLFSLHNSTLGILYAIINL